MQRLKNPSIQPPQRSSEGGFVYVHQETKHKSVATDCWSWMDRIKAHRRSNGLSEITDEQAQDQLCQTLPPGWCDRDKTDPEWINPNITISDVVGASRIYREWKKQGKLYVNQEEATRRAAICAGCYLNVHVGGCGGLCQELISLAAETKDLPPTGYEPKLENCAVCHCTNAVQNRFDLTLLELEDSTSRQSQYPGFCWKQKSSVNYIAP